MIYLASKPELQCYSASGQYRGSASDLWEAAELAGEGGTVIHEMCVGERVYTVKNGVCY